MEDPSFKRLNGGAKKDNIGLLPTDEKEELHKDFNYDALNIGRLAGRFCRQISQLATYTSKYSPYISEPILIFHQNQSQSLPVLHKNYCRFISSENTSDAMRKIVKVSIPVEERISVAIGKNIRQNSNPIDQPPDGQTPKG